MRKIEGRLFIEPLMGKDVPVGSVLILYSSRDENIFNETLKERLDQAGIPYFLDKKDIKPGDEWEHRLDEAYRSTSCGIPILTRNSIKSPWVLYEIGYLCGREKKVVPYLSTFNLNTSEKEKFMGEIPQFIKRFQYSEKADQIIETVRKEILYVGDLFSNNEINKRVVAKLVQLKLTLELDDVQESIDEKLRFGYQIVRFGRWEFQTKEPRDSEIDETDRIHKIFYKSDSNYTPDARTLRIDFVIPMHRKWGTTFKLFVDVPDLSLIDDVKQLLIHNELEDVKQSQSGEKQRIYFLIPKGHWADVVHEPYESIDVRNNYIFPV